MNLKLENIFKIHGDLVAQMVNGNAGHLGSIPGLGRFPEEKGMATHSSMPARRIPWREEPVG